MSHIDKFIEMHKEGKLPASTLIKAAAFKAELEKDGANLDVKSFLTYLAAGLGVSAGLGLASGVAQLGVDAYMKHKTESEIDSLFADMLRLHPELREKRERSLLYFKALAHFSPAVIQNPLAAGAYIKQALQFDYVAGGPLPETVNMLSQIQKLHTDARKDAPKGTLGTMFSGLKESPTKIMPSFLSYGDFNG